MMRFTDNIYETIAALCMMISLFAGFVSALMIIFNASGSFFNLLTVLMAFSNFILVMVMVIFWVINGEKLPSHESQK